MCASAIRWAGFKEYIYGTSIEYLIEKGWGQITVSSAEIFERSGGLSTETSLLGDILVNETDAYFAWQFDDVAGCPPGCRRDEMGCVAS